MTKLAGGLRLDPKKLLETAARLERRIGERFVGSGLASVCNELVKCSSNAAYVCVSIRRPNTLLRVVSGVSITSILVVVLGAAWLALEEATSSSSGAGDWRDIPTVGEAIVNELILLGAAVWFFVTLERNQKRGRVIQALAELRTLAHLIDIHQLSKNPETIGEGARDTPSSPKRSLTSFEMGRYLDYCSEMLALTGKVAALYGEAFNDADAVKAVNDLEELCIGLQRKIWQKIIIVENRSDLRKNTLFPTTSAEEAIFEPLAEPMTAPATNPPVTNPPVTKPRVAEPMGGPVAESMRLIESKTNQRLFAAESLPETAMSVTASDGEPEEE